MPDPTHILDLARTVGVLGYHKEVLRRAVTTAIERQDRRARADLALLRQIKCDKIERKRLGWQH